MLLGDNDDEDDYDNDDANDNAISTRQRSVMRVLLLISMGIPFMTMTMIRHLGELKFKQKGREEQCEPDNPTQAKKVTS